MKSNILAYLWLEILIKLSILFNEKLNYFSVPKRVYKSTHQGNWINWTGQLISYQNNISCVMEGGNSFII